MKQSLNDLKPAIKECDNMKSLELVLSNIDEFNKRYIDTYIDSIDNFNDADLFNNFKNILLVKNY